MQYFTCICLDIAVVADIFLKGESGRMFCVQCPTGRVFQYRVRSGPVLDKIPGSGSGSGRVGVSKYTIGYFRVSFLLSGISGYVLAA